MNGVNREYNNSGPEGPEQPPYDFYKQGVTRVSWPAAIYAAIRKGDGGQAVANVAILTLGTIACVLAMYKEGGIALLILIGCLGAMICTIGLVAMSLVRKGYHAENTEEDESETTEPGAGNEGSNKNGAAPR